MATTETRLGEIAGSQAVQQPEPATVPLLPAEVPMSDEERNELLRYVDEEITAAQFERTEFVNRLIDFQKAYRTPKPRTTKDWPMKKASQITMPLAKMTVNVLAPRIIDDLVRPQPIWSVRSTLAVQAFERVAKPTEDFLDLYAHRRINIEDKIESMILEGCKLGTAVIEVAMQREIRQSARYDLSATSIEVIDEDVFVGPQIHNVPLEDFWWKFGFTDLQQMPWVGKVVHLSKRELDDRVRSGKFRALEIEAVKRQPTTFVGSQFNVGRVRAEREKHERTQPNVSTFELFDIHELYLYWPIKVNGREVIADLLVYYHAPTRSLLRIQLNPWWHRRRPFLVWQYTPVEHRLVGEGIAEQVEQFQEEISALHNLRIDNATLANMRMILVTKMVEGLRPGDPLYPGKVIKVTRPDDVTPFQLSEIYPSTVLNENISMQFVERVTGINEAILGSALPVTRTTATAQLTLLEENARRFNLTIRRARRAIEQAGEMVYDLFHQFGTGGLTTLWLGSERGLLVDMLLTMPRESVVKGMAVRVAATSSKVNKQMEMQSNLQLFQLMVSLHQQILGLVQGLAPQTLPFIAQSLVASSKKFMLRVLESFDERDPEGVLQALTLLERVLPRAEVAGEQLAENLEVIQQIIQALPEQIGLTVDQRVSQLEGAIAQVRQRQGQVGFPQNGGVPVAPAEQSFAPTGFPTL